MNAGERIALGRNVIDVGLGLYHAQELAILMIFLFAGTFVILNL
jgi:hypothetical protein